MAAETQNENIAEEKNKYAKLLEEERANVLQNDTRVIIKYFSFLPCSFDCRLRFMMLHGFFNRFRNWRSQTRSCSSAGKRFRKLSLRYSSLRNLHIVSSHRVRGFSFCFYFNCMYLPQTSVLLDEAKIREDARNVQHKCLEKDYAALKEENKQVRQ